MSRASKAADTAATVIRTGAVVAASVTLATSPSVRLTQVAPPQPSPVPSVFWPCPDGQNFGQLPDGKWGCRK